MKYYIINICICIGILFLFSGSVVQCLRVNCLLTDLFGVKL